MKNPAPDIDLTAAARLVVEDHRAAPCAVVAAARRTSSGWVYGRGAAGTLSFEQDAPLADVETPFDLASLTKPVTALVMARLARRGSLARSEPLADLVPALANTRSARVSLDLLSAHRAGLDAHGPLYAPLVRGEPVDVEAALAMAADMRREGCAGDPPPEGFPPVYSDLGYVLLGAALARRSGVELDALVTREVTGPLELGIGSARRLHAMDASFDTRVAPTEIVPFRDGLVRGVVHDENAWALVGRASAGHAGLFGDARSVVRLGVAVLEALAGERDDFLGPEDVAPLVRPRPGGSLLAGFDQRSGDDPSSGARLGPRTFGHLGFTGTSVWMDPDAGFVGVLLTNRVHPTRTSLAIRRARPAAYDAMVEAMRAG
ncbi:serine hydrolase domain-containing protein [Polyangium spumosum]|uniref:serine hydrolase domain-containing protein n=1 Tax=Polyangium spumosum TaxID=889282 RepID=UPI003084252D